MMSAHHQKSDQSEISRSSADNQLQEKLMEHQDVLVCGICMDYYDEASHQPKFLSCHHSFCESCLLLFANGQSKIECPSCRTITTLTESGPAGLQTNFYLSSIRKMFKTIGAGQNCVYHNYQPTSFFCKSCSQPICRDCTVLDHKESDGHCLQNITSAEREQRELLQKELGESDEFIRQLELSLQRLTNEKTNLLRSKAAVVMEIEITFEKYLEMLEKHKRTLVNTVNDLHKSDDDEIAKVYSNLEGFLKETHKLTKRSNSVLLHGTLAEVVAIKDRVKKGTKEGRTLMQNVHLGKNSIHFSVENDRVQQFLSQLGKISQEQCLPSRFSFKSSSITACLPAEVTMTVKSFNGDPLPHSKYIEVTVLDCSEAAVDSTLITRAQNSEYVIRFTPPMSGKYYIVPKFHGQAVKGAHHKVVVGSNNPVAKYGGLGEGNGKFHSPRALTLDRDGNIYVADTGNRLVQKLDRNGKFLYQFKIGESQEDCSTCDLTLTPDESAIICTETFVGTTTNPSTGNTVAVYSTSGVFKHKFTNKVMKCALCIASTPQGELIVSDYLMHCLFVYNEKGSFLRKIGESEILNHPSFICIGENESILVSDTNNNHVLEFDKEGKLINTFGRLGSGKAELKQPFGVATRGDHIIVVDSGNQRIEVFSKTGNFVSMIQSTDDPLDQPRGIAVTNDGHVLVADRENHCIKKYRYK